MGEHDDSRGRGPGMPLAFSLSIILVLVCGCLDAGTGSSESTTTVGVSTTLAQEFSPTSVLANPDSPPAIPVTSTTSVKGPDTSNLEVIVTGCSDDDFGNSSVAGYVNNPTGNEYRRVTVFTYLADENRELIDGGKRGIMLEDVDSYSRTSFSTVYENPGEWSVCTAVIE